MPYIHPRLRTFAEKNPCSGGELNFAITTLVNSYLEKQGVRYATLNEVIGVLECAKLELYRRIAAPYEDTKIEENGDVYTVGEDNPPLRGDSPSTCPDPHCC